MKKTVVIIQRYIPHYRIPFFTKLEKSFDDIDISVFYGKLMDEEINETDLNFKHKKFDLKKITFFGYSLEFQWKLFFELLRFPPDLVILEGTFGIVTNILLLLVRKISNKKTIYWTAGWDNPEISGVKHKLKTLIIRFLLSVSNGAIVYGSKAKDYLLKHGMKEQNITIAQNTIDIESIIKKNNELKKIRELKRKQLNIEDKKVIIFVGTLVKRKKIDLLLQAYKNLKEKQNEFVLIIIGEGPELDNINQYITLNNLNDVLLIGKVIKNVEDIICIADVFVLPGTGGLAINQALATGIPVIAAESDGTEQDLIENGVNGYLLTSDDCENLINTIQKTSNNFLYNHSSLLIQDLINKKASLSNMIMKFNKTIMNMLNQ